jgi:hypothetical protein
LVKAMLLVLKVMLLDAEVMLLAAEVMLLHAEVISSNLTQSGWCMESLIKTT